MKLIHKYDINHHRVTHLYPLSNISTNTKLTNFTQAQIHENSWNY